MKLNKPIVLVLFLIFLLALTVASQISQITNTISIEEIKTCTTSFYDEVQNVYGNCNFYFNYTDCLNTTGPNTACSIMQKTLNYTCKTGEAIVKNNKTECISDEKFIITVDKGVGIIKKQIDFSDWGPCIHENKNNCLVVTCVSKYDGAHNGQFTDCNGGKSCQRFEICDNSIKTLYKNSRNDFVEYDPTFYLSKLEIKEVSK